MLIKFVGLLLFISFFSEISNQLLSKKNVYFKTITKTPTIIEGINYHIVNGINYYKDLKLFFNVPPYINTILKFTYFIVIIYYYFNSHVVNNYI